MPSPWKKNGVSRLISGLRSKPPAGASLVLVAGFPTSLADLVVKNRARLKRPSRKTKPDTVTGTGTGTVTDTDTSPAIAIVDRSPRCSIPVAVERKKNWCGFLVAKLFVLAILAIGEKQIVVRITIAAFTLVILDLFGFRAFEVLGLNLMAGEGRAGASPVRDVGVVRRLESSERIREVSVGSRDLVVVEKADPNTKKKRRWRRFLPKRHRGGMKAEIAKVVPDFDGEDEEKGKSDGEVLKGENCNEISELNVEGSHPVRRYVSAAEPVSSRQSLLFVVLLFGLVGGRVAALAATVAWFVLTKYIGALWRQGID